MVVLFLFSSAFLVHFWCLGDTFLVMLFFCFFPRDFQWLWRGKVAIAIKESTMRLLSACNEGSIETLLVSGDLIFIEIQKFEVQTSFL
jgi:hypothetical protein